MDKNSRINKWRKYREEIDTNESIHFSIVNTDKELKKMLDSIDFDIEKEYEKIGFQGTSSKESTIKKQINEKKEIENILSIIEKNETIQTSNRLIKEFNSHKYDEIINTNFLEFLDKEQLKNQQDQETTDLKINRINITEIKKEK